MAHAIAIKSKQSGSWTAASTWEGGSLFAGGAVYGDGLFKQTAGSTTFFKAVVQQYTDILGGSVYYQNIRAVRPRCSIRCRYLEQAQRMRLKALLAR